MNELSFRCGRRAEKKEKNFTVQQHEAPVMRRHDFKIHFSWKDIIFVSKQVTFSSPCSSVLRVCEGQMRAVHSQRYFFSPLPSQTGPVGLHIWENLTAQCRNCEESVKYTGWQCFCRRSNTTGRFLTMLHLQSTLGYNSQGFAVKTDGSNTAVQHIYIYTTRERVQFIQQVRAAELFHRTDHTVWESQQPLWL